ncbi:P-loop containing nucleoside triphosphate hydrolase protein [Cylindrobasidium torrendii FP15055 ss-10]|uniref:p-loop containing nucleoside triphosphate hydrolase protein n=1 Tax=Cylindrobasidium torrendii FP15055 ss-10 TaxID=1314674 RepID=A0A0D7B863_9AGAR|nr:P-loop containing nucleoside triphosphate hydrolase protein [Cylindrobasidium torrendii FP15055 ss-10]
MASNDARSARLKRQFDTVLDGKITLDTASKSKLFLEAIPLLPDAALTIERIVTAPPGLTSLQSAMRSDLSAAGISRSIAVLTYFQDPSVKAVSHGSLLARAVKAIAAAAAFWDTFVTSFKEGRLDEAGQCAFGWILLELIRAPDDSVSPHLPLATDAEPILRRSIYLPVRHFGDQITEALAISSTPAVTTPDSAPGGRHDNDYADFREIAILPTASEISCTEDAFLRLADALEDEDTRASRPAIYIDHMFRLLREDMLYELREEMQTLLGKTKGRKHRGTVIDGLKLIACELGPPQRRDKWGVVLECTSGIPVLTAQKSDAKRRQYIKENHRFLKRQSLTCVFADGKIIAFPTIRRDEQRLGKEKPEVVLELNGEKAMQNLLLHMKTARSVKLVQIDVALFAYEPVLDGLKRIRTLPLTEELLLWRKADLVSCVTLASKLELLVNGLRRDPKRDISKDIGLDKTINLDPAQSRALLSGLTQKVSIIQGPPGTGKSFIGAIIAKYIFLHTDLKILVVCYTNHALDQFLEDLLDIGIDSDYMVRLGAKGTSRTEPLLLRNQHSTHKFGRNDHADINNSKSDVENRATRLEAGFQRYLHSSANDDDLLAYLECEEEEFFAAFEVPVSKDGMTMVDRKGKAIGEHYLLQRWKNGQDAGQFSDADNVLSDSGQRIWGMDKNARSKNVAMWIEELCRESVNDLYRLARGYNLAVEQLQAKFKEKDGHILKSKRVIGCTTTAAAMYNKTIQDASPDVILVEEAGEILECHVVTALGESAEQLILIGDHKQLRPKVNNYKLTVEKGDGFDLNRSLFERLVLKGYPHDTLVAQHRMRPEISRIVRHLTYPDLKDAPKTQGRLDLRGVRDNVVFINHDKPEDQAKEGTELHDAGSKSSKQNRYEARMVLKIVRFLAQQGYKTDNLVVLTPYLGQLSLLKKELAEETDPVLNDLDSSDLIAAGFMTPAAAKTAKHPLRLATIDNYQGEESDIVIASMTRSNSNHDIGFMFAPERLNVLLSRARDGLIMIGNSDTFTRSKKGGPLWRKFFEVIHAHVYNGFPIRCEKHPTRHELITSEAEFEQKCPDGGCDEPCGAALPCGLHKCPRACHQIDDHSKVYCKELITLRCPKGHDQTKQCSGPPVSSCGKCDREKKRDEDKKQKEFERKQKRDKEEADHLLAKKELEEKLEEARQEALDEKVRTDRENEIKMKLADLEDIRKRNQQAKNKPTTPASPNAGTRGSSPKSTPGTGGNPSGNSNNNPSSRGTGSTPNGGGGNNGSGSTPGSSGPTPPSGGPTPPSSGGAPNPPSGGGPDPPSGGGGPDPSSSGGPNSGGPSNPPGSGPSSATSSIGPDPQRLPAIHTAPALVRNRSVSEAAWDYKKSIEGVFNKHIEQIMQLTGLEEVKAQILRIWDKVEVAQRQGVDASMERMNVVFLGNPGTGKTTVARHYARYLSSVGVLPGKMFEETTGASIANDGVKGAKDLLQKVRSGGGGAVFVDEAYQLVSAHNTGGASVLDYLLAEMENNVGQIVFILAGYNKEMEKFFEHNPGLLSRVPYRFQFKDYEDAELLVMLENMMHWRWKGRMKVEDGAQGLYGRIAVRRLGRGRGRSGFGNARALENMLATITARQADRIAKERKTGVRPDDMLLLREDIIGPDPAVAIQRSESWTKLHKLTGLGSVKQAVQDLYDMILANYARELKEQGALQVTLNRAFLGSPGTGKTTVAKLYGQILSDLGLLSNGEVVVKNPSDFIGGYIGHSEMQTRAILASTAGKVLVIDEAYMLYGGSKGGNTDTFKTAVIDTIVAEVQSTLGEDRCVLLLGYEKQMKDMFLNVNDGLSRRFSIEDAFKFEDFTTTELGEILDLKMAQGDLKATPDARSVALDVLERAKLRPNFGNGGDVENLLGKAKTNFTQRHRGNRKALEYIVFEPVDFDAQVNRTAMADSNLDDLFKDTIGSDDLVERLRTIQKTGAMAKKRGEKVSELVPTTFVFKGPPGTGKTTTARKMGQVYYDMGMLSKPDVHECSASDVVGKYVGHTGPLVRKVFEKALGQVLFIDEAYRLKEGHFAREAVDEIVTLLTDEAFKGKLIVILAGYDDDMNALLASNRGLSSRFTEEVTFVHFTTENCITMLVKQLAKRKVIVPGLDDQTTRIHQTFDSIFDDFLALKSWGNGRDVETLARMLIEEAYKTSPSVDPKDDLTLREGKAVTRAKTMLKERRKREGVKQPRQSFFSGSPPPMAPPRGPPSPPPGPADPGSAPPPAAGPPSNDDDKNNPNKKAAPGNKPPSGDDDGRDPGVSDAVWAELQAARAANDAEEKRIQAEVDEADRIAREAYNKEIAEHARLEELKRQEAAERDRIRQEELKKQREAQMRLEAEAARRRKQLEADAKARRDAQEQTRKRQAEAMKRLQASGRCVAGFQWHRVGSGWRCAGGTHFASDRDIGM